MIQYFYILQSDHHNEPNLYSSPHIVIKLFMIITFKIYSLSHFQIYTTLLLTTVTMLYIWSPGLTYFIIGSLRHPFIYWFYIHLGLSFASVCQNDLSVFSPNAPQAYVINISSTSHCWAPDPMSPARLCGYKVWRPLSDWITKDRTSNYSPGQHRPPPPLFQPHRALPSDAVKRGDFQKTSADSVSLIRE